jgi:hypothetical protein
MTSAAARELADALGKLAEKIKPPADDADSLKLLTLVADLENLARHLRASTSATDEAYGVADRIVADGDATLHELGELADRCR